MPKNLNPKSLAAAQSGTQARHWKYINGPETGCGAEYWLEHKNGITAYVCIDQGELSGLTIYDPVCES